MTHQSITDDDLERYHLGMLSGDELEQVEEHLLVCADCADRAAESAAYVQAMRGALIAADWEADSSRDRDAAASDYNDSIEVFNTFQ